MRGGTIVVAIATTLDPILCLRSAPNKPVQRPEEAALPLWSGRLSAGAHVGGEGGD